MTSNDRATRTIRITNDAGLHLPAATKLVQLANRFTSDIRIAKGDKEANAKSIMGVLMLVAAKDSMITITATGADADAAISAIAQLVTDRFGESS